MDHSPPSWSRVSDLFDLALELPVHERSAFLDRACAGDIVLRNELESLLAADAQAGTFLEGDALSIVRDAAGSGSERLPPADRAGDVVGQFRLQRRLGYGGMGDVYVAHRFDGQFEQRVALKLIRPGVGSAEVIRRFIAERQILARLQHPNIAQLIDGGATSVGQPWFAMELIEGAPITTWCDEHRLGIPERLQLFEHVCEGVRFAHQRLVVHRDLKPSNILVNTTGEPKLLDFGISKVLGDGDSGGDPKTLTGIWLMTPEYGAPEQVRGDPITTATDVYSLGVVLFELLTGHRPYRMERLTPREMERAICDTDPITPSAAVTGAVERHTRDGGVQRTSVDALAAARQTTPEKLRHLLRGDLETIVLKALRKDPAERYPSAEALLEDLRLHRAGLPVRARQLTAAYQFRKFVRRHRVGLAAAAAVVLALASGLATTLWQARVARQEAKRATAVTNFLIGVFRSTDPAEAKGRDVSAREILDRGVAELDTAFANQPALKSELLGVLGILYRGLSLYPRADSVLRRSLELARSSSGPESPAVAARLSDLGSVLHNEGKYVEAESLLARAVTIRRRTLGARHPDLAASLLEWGIALQALGRDSASERARLDAVAIDRDFYGSEHTEYISDLAGLAVFYAEVDRPREADSLSAIVLDWRRQHEDSLSPNLLTAMYNRALRFTDKGELDSSEALLREVERKRRILHPSGSDEIAYPLHSLGTVMLARGRLAEADSLFRAALNIRATALGPRHPLTAQTVNQLAVTSYRRGDFVSAESLFQLAGTSFDSTHGPQHRYTVTARQNRAAALIELRRFSEAEVILREELQRAVNARGPDDVQVATIRRNFGVVLHRTGRLAAAERELRETLRVTLTSYDAGNPRLADVWTSLGDLLIDRGKAAEAEPMLADALRIRERALDETDPRVVETRRQLARARTQLPTR